jgi:hypothetical protein
MPVSSTTRAVHKVTSTVGTPERFGLCRFQSVLHSLICIAQFTRKRCGLPADDNNELNGKGLVLNDSSLAITVEGCEDLPSHDKTTHLARSGQGAYSQFHL